MKAEDATCPFCGAATVGAAPAGRAMKRRMSRAAWLASGAALAVACSEHLPDANNTRSGESVADAAAAADEASVDAAPVDASTSFACVGPYDASTTCTAPQEYCVVTINYNCFTACNSQNPAPTPPNCPIASATPHCEAADGTHDAGSKEEVTGNVFTGCGGCYGCPPARLFV